MNERDLDALERRLRSAAPHSPFKVIMQDAADAIAALRARAERAETDAERYRWLRERANMDYPVRHGAPGVSVNMPTGNNACHYPVQSDLDAAIDRARTTGRG